MSPKIETQKELTAENQIVSSFQGAPGGTRTRTAVSGQGILSPSCLPFHHQGVSSAIIVNDAANIGKKEV